MEELEQALKKYNMGDAKTIREIIAEVDTDNVCIVCIWPLLLILYAVHKSDVLIRSDKHDSPASPEVSKEVCLVDNFKARSKSRIWTGF